MKKLTLLTTALIVSSSFAHYRAEAQDFLYLMPSKEIAETGEDFFFKAYLMDRQTFALSDRSQTLYLQVRSKSDSVVWSEKYPLVSGRGNGHIYIGTDWPQGEYFLEGYTKSSFTSDSTQEIRPRRIRVVDNVVQMDSIVNQETKNYDTQKLISQHRFDLFPEGGHLVNGIYSVVAFKATYGNGIPEEVSGKVLEDGKEIASIQTLHDGMGRFAFTPKQGKEYQVILDDDRTIPFPKIESEGLSLRVSSNNAKGLSLLISSTDDAPQNFSITAKQNGRLCCTAKGTVKGQRMVNLPAEYFTLQGIVEITLNDASERPIAERLVFVNPEKRLNITTVTDQSQYYRRDTGKVVIQVTDTVGNPIKAELAVSIFDKAYLYQPGHENILSHCFLSEQIRGNVFNPTYYFDPKNDDRLQALDLLMMTQGWRNYVWDKELPTAQTLLQDGVCGKDLDNRMQIIKALCPQGDTCHVLSDHEGRFELDPSKMEKMRGNIYLQPILTKPRPKIALVSPFDTINVYQRGRTRILVCDHIISQKPDNVVIKSNEGTIALDEVVVSAKRRNFARDKVIGFLDSLAIMSSGEWVCDCKAGSTDGYLNDYRGYSHHPVGSPMASNHSGNRKMPQRGHVYTLIKYEPLGDGRAGFGNWVITEYPNRGYKYPGPQYTEEELLQIYGMWKAQGYYPKREFYQPDQFDLQSSTADPRNLLQWQPEVLTDENGTAVIPFSTSDVNSEFIGSVEAIDGNGLMGYQIFSFRVLKQSF